MATPTTVITVQQVSTYNHPCGDLLDEGRRQEYLDTAVPLYRASMKGDWEAANVILQDHEYLVRYSISENKETPLHVAAAYHHAIFVRNLVSMMNAADLELQNEDGNTAFCLAAISGSVYMATIMLKKNIALYTICGSENKTPLYLAAFHGNKNTVRFLYRLTNRMRGASWTNDVMDEVLLKCIQADIFDVALEILEDNEQLPQDKGAWDVLQVLARKPSAFHPETQTSIITKLLSLYVSLCITPVPLVENMAVSLLRLLWERIMEKPKDVIDKILRGPLTIVQKATNANGDILMETYPSQIQFIAAKMNNTHFLVELIHKYPDLIWKRNDDGQTIFHVAVSHRHHDIYNLLYEIGTMKDLIIPLKDKEGNNILHLVGKNPVNNAYKDWVATPFHMFSEFSWHKEVESILPPPCRDVTNAAGETPQELFTENHKELVSDGMKWVNDTINISMVVAALVSTIGFSVVYSIPGGFNQKNGYPILLRHNYFIAFVVLDVISFILSTTSIIFFLSVFLSRDSGNMKFLLRKWVTGQLLLLGSVCFLVIAFILSFFILYLKSTYWTYIIYTFIFLLTILYRSVCGYHVLDALRTAYGSKFRPGNHRLYRKT